MNTGWICPACGKGVAPHVSTCDHGGFDGVVTPYQPRTWPNTTAPFNTGDPIPPTPNYFFCTTSSLPACNSTTLPRPS